MFRQLLFCQLLLIDSVAGHGMMNKPSSRFNTTLAYGQCGNHGCLWFSQGCQIGCASCSDKSSGDTCSEPGGSMTPTVTNAAYRTFPAKCTGDVTPWRAPGYAPIGSPCGLAGGGDTPHPSNGAVAPRSVPVYTPVFSFCGL